MSVHKIHKAVIPAAGLGTRFLPATKSVPKEMLPVVDTPAIDYIVREAVVAGLNDVLLIAGRGKGAIEDYFDHNVELEQLLAEKGDTQRLQMVESLTRLAKVHSVRQGKALGLGHAVLMAEKHVGGEPFAVLLGDDLIDDANPVLETMAEARQRLGGSVICLMEVPQESISLYGVAAVEPTDQPDMVRVTDLVEKPPADEAPSNLAIIGRYVLNPAVFPVLRKTPKGRGGEIQLTDALRDLITMSPEDGGGVHALLFRGLRYDTGDRQSYLEA
ncbi:MAG: UTP--glucose-1-phosphate uridylyltransferase, partial [Candidatus Nanopelagicales bacterium]|nr:UTP--glucose-1-phosphate uridylyltransferase [Candidatus Nanopelagicales bacterium]